MLVNQNAIWFTTQANIVHDQLILFNVTYCRCWQLDYAIDLIFMRHGTKWMADGSASTKQKSIEYSKDLKYFYLFIIFETIWTNDIQASRA